MEYKLVVMVKLPEFRNDRSGDWGINASTRENCVKMSCLTGCKCVLSLNDQEPWEDVTDCIG